MRSPRSRAMAPPKAAGWRSSAFAGAIRGAARAQTLCHDNFEDQSLVNDNRNMILAVVLSALVLIGWSMLSERLMPPTGDAADADGRQRQGRAGAAAASEPGADGAAGGPRPRRGARLDRRGCRSAPRACAGRSTSRARGSTTWCCFAKRSRWKRIRRPSGCSRRPARPAPISPASAGAARACRRPAPTRMWTASAPVLEPGKPVTLSTANASGQQFALVIAVDENYLFTVRQQVANRGSAPIAIRPYGFVNRARKSADADSWTMHVGPIGFLGDAAEYGTNWDDLENRQVKRFDSRGGWVGFTDKYWLTALSPVGSPAISASLTGTPAGGFQADYAQAQQIVPGRRNAGQRGPPVRRRQGKSAARPLRGRRHPAAVQVDRLGLVRMVHAADLRPSELAVQSHRQLRRRDHLPDLHRPADHVPDRAEAVPVDGGDAQGAAQDQGDAGALQGRQAEAAAGDAEAVQGREDQPGRRLPADPAADPDLLRACTRC